MLNPEQRETLAETETITSLAGALGSSTGEVLAD